MLSKIKSMALEGINGYLVETQCDVSGGLPNFDIVGLPDIRVKESKERVRIAIKNSGYEFPSRRIIVNLSPADKRKEGTFFDLSIAIGILVATDEIDVKINLENTIFLGELSLDGKVNHINGILPMCIEAVNLGIENVVLPIENLEEATIINKLKIIAVENLNDVIDFVGGKEIEKNHIKEDKKQLDVYDEYKIDFSEVKGQENAKRALEIAAAGRTQLPTYSVVLVLGKQCFQKD